MNDLEIKEMLAKHYSVNCNEDERLIRDRAHNIEFITTNKYIEKYLKKGDKILEIGAATGRYSLYYAKKGYEVEAVELLENNLKVLKSKIEPEMKINAAQANAKDLSRYKDETFNITLCLGPLYHLYTQEDRDIAIKEAIRVTKKGGIIYFAYITNEAVILNYGLRKGNLLRLDKLLDEKCEVEDNPEEIFAVSRVDKFNKSMEKYKLENLHQVAVDGLSQMLADKIEGLTQEEYEVWKKIHFKICERKDLIGYSSHVLYIAKK